MLSSSDVSPTIPVTDLQRAKKFYQEILGLSIVKEASGGITFKAGSSHLYIYKRGPSKADHTLASFRVENLEQAVDEMSKNGVVFEQYDFPGLKTNEKGIATMEAEGEKAAWFKDPDGNILALGEKI